MGAADAPTHLLCAKLSHSSENRVPNDGGSCHSPSLPMALCDRSTRLEGTRHGVSVAAPARAAVDSYLKFCSAPNSTGRQGMRFQDKFRTCSSFINPIDLGTPPINCVWKAGYGSRNVSLAGMRRWCGTTPDIASPQSYVVLQVQVLQASHAANLLGENTDLIPRQVAPHAANPLAHLLRSRTSIVGREPDGQASKAQHTPHTDSGATRS